MNCHAHHSLLVRFLRATNFARCRCSATANVCRPSASPLATGIRLGPASPKNACSSLPASRRHWWHHQWRYGLVRFLPRQFGVVDLFLSCRIQSMPPLLQRERSDVHSDALYYASSVPPSPARVETAREVGLHRPGTPTRIVARPLSWRPQASLSATLRRVCVHGIQLVLFS